MTNFINKIIHADCLEILEQLPDESIDAVITDPPYNIGKADWDIWKTPQNYFDFMSICFGRFERVLKPNGSFYFFHNNMPFISELMQILKLTKFYFISFVVVHKVNHRKKTWKTKKTKLRSWFNVCDYLLHYVKLEGNNQNSTGLEQIYNNPECFKSIKQYMKDERDKIIKDKGFKTLAEFNNYINKVTETKRVVSRHYFSDSQYFFPYLRNI